MIFGARIKKKQSNSNFDAAWALTRSFEGPWDEKGDDVGHYFPQPSVPDDWYAPLPKPAKKKVGTGWGLTSQFLYDFVPGYQGANMPTKEVMQRLGDRNDDSLAKGIWEGTCWKWMRGDSIHNQKIANILFDCFVRAQGRSTKFATQLNLKCESITYEKLKTRASDDVQGERTKKIWVFTDAIVNKLNTMDEMDIISKIKMVWGKKYEDTDTMCRFNAILQGKLLSDPVVQKACIVEGDKRRNAKKQTQNKFYDDAITTRKILFFTQKGCVPCLQLKPTCEALARQNDFSFQEVDIRTDSGKILMTQYRVGATPEVVLIDGNLTKQWGAADLFDDKLARYLSNLPIPVDPFDDGKPVEPAAQAQSDGNWALPLAAGAFAWYHFKSKKRIGNPDDNQNLMIGGGLLLLLWLSSDSTGAPIGGALTAQELDAILNLTLLNEGPWEAETAHTRKDKGNYHRGKGSFLGTSWGITANFLEDWYGTKSFASDAIKNISKDDAKKILIETVMTRARIADIQDKWIAALFFDWMLHRPSTCLEYVCLKAFKMNDADYQSVRKGFYSTARIPDVLVSRLNGENRKGTFEAIKLWRLDHLENTCAYANFREGIRKRINRYQYGI